MGVMDKNSSPQNRIFWLGMHKILVQTELPRLRMLGYEVFNPPYLSEIPDQSANLNWDSCQESTLPQAIFNKLSSYNFFYNDIDPEIGAILNKYFDAVIVTISASWLAAIAKVYKGRLVFRTYGQHTCLSDDLAENGLLVNLSTRSNFHFVPHAEEALNGEHSWLKKIAQVVPYCLPADIFQHSNGWIGPDKYTAAEVALTCPNIGNAFFNKHYQYLKKNFSQNHYKYFGVQLSKVDDDQIVGTLNRDELIARMKHCACYLYTYADPRVCYLPPIEMMVLGGPVLYMRDSLLDNYFHKDAPGRCETIEEAHEKVNRLLNGDEIFLNELRRSQEHVKQRYDPSFVWPIFDGFFSNIFKTDLKPAEIFNKELNATNSDIKKIYILHHFPGDPVVWDGGKYAAYDGIPRVMRQLVKEFASKPGIEVFITARHDQAQSIYGYFEVINEFRSRVKILIIDNEPPQKKAIDKPRMLDRLTKKVKAAIKSVVPAKYWPLLWKLSGLFRRSLSVFRASPLEQGNGIAEEARYVETINSDDQCEFVIIPHYYCFPESLLINKKTFLYLPDYMPHFFHETGEFKGDEGLHTEIGKKIVQKADVVFCNSNFTKGYLPISRLKVPAEKIRVFYLPMLNVENTCADLIPPNELLQPRKYIFYPTQPRPNKNLSFLLKVFNSLVDQGYDIQLVLTARLESEPSAFLTFNSLGAKNRVLFLERITDETLAWLYKNAGLLCFTSLAEGNFPPQVLEALAYDTPIVASNLGFVTERIPMDISDAIMLCNPKNLDEYVDACKKVLDKPDAYLAKQRLLKKVLLSSADNHFGKEIDSIFFEKRSLCV